MNEKYGKFTVIIRDSDVKYRHFRILKDNKKFFPQEEIGQYESYSIEIIYHNNVIPATYVIGSKDGKSRSGKIRFDRSVYDNLSINSGDILIIEVINPEHTYKLSFSN